MFAPKQKYDVLGFFAQRLILVKKVTKEENTKCTENKKENRNVQLCGNCLLLSRDLQSSKSSSDRQWVVSDRYNGVSEFLPTLPFVAVCFVCLDGQACVQLYEN